MEGVSRDPGADPKYSARFGKRQNLLTRLRDSTATWEAGFAKMLARGAELQGKKVVFRRENQTLGMRDFRKKRSGNADSGSSLTISYLPLHVHSQGAYVC